jgi:hypothetical protein
LSGQFKAPIELGTVIDLMTVSVAEVISFQEKKKELNVYAATYFTQRFTVSVLE